MVKIYKGKGALDEPNNYRPISLLSTAHKLLASILQQSLYILLLDWKQAFDKVSVEALQVALRRYEVLEGILNLIKSGIRQGCPPSPYLFLIVHSMILYDVDKQLLENGGLLPWVFSPFL